MMPAHRASPRAAPHRRSHADGGGKRHPGDIRASQSGDTQNFTADSLSVDALAAGMHRWPPASGWRLSATRDADGLRAGLGTASADQMRLEPPRSSIRPGPGGPLVHIVTPAPRPGAQRPVHGARFDTGSAHGSVDTATVQGAALSRSEQDHRGRRVRQDVQCHCRRVQPVTRRIAQGNLGVDHARLGIGLVQDAQVSASVDLHAGDLGVAGLRAEPGPVPSWAPVKTPHPRRRHWVGLQALDGPPDVRERCVPGRWRLRADVRGWADKDITEDINEAMGVRSDRVPDIATIGSGIADQMRQSGDSATELSGPIDMDSAHLEALVQLGDGVIDGGIMRADLASAEQAGDNRLDISARDASLTTAIDRFLADSSSYSNNGVSASTGRAEASGVDLSSNPEQWSIQVDEFSGQDLRGSRQ